MHDLDVEWQRPRPHGGKRPRRRVLRKIAAVDFIHGVEVGRIGDVDGALQHFVERRSGGLEAGLDTLHAALGLYGDVGALDLHGVGVERRDAGDEYVVTRAGNRRERHFKLVEEIRNVGYAKNLLLHGSSPLFFRP